MPDTATAVPDAREPGRLDRWVVIGAVVALALVLRLAFLAQIATTPFGQALFLDSLGYAQAAAGLLADGPLGGGAYFVDPLYTYFLAAVFLLTSHSVLAVRLLQALLGAATAGLTVWLGEELSGDRRIGVLAGVGVASYALLIFHDLQILKTPLVVFLGVGSVSLLVAARRRRSTALHLLAGAVLGVGTLGHGSYLLLVPVFCAGIVLGRRGADARRGARAAAALLGGALLAIAPVTIRNAAVSGEFVLTTYNAGMNFWEGNNPESDGAYRRPSFLRGDPLLEEQDSRREAERRAGRALGPSEISAFWFRESFRWIAAHPGAWLALCARKALLFWNHHEVDDNLSFYFVRQFVPFLAWPLPGFRVWGALGLAGMAWLVPRAQRWATAYVFVACQTAAIVAFHVVDRYRLPVVPFLILFGSALAVSAWDAAVARRFGRVGAAAALALAAAALVNVPRFYDPEETFSRPYYALGKFYFEHGEPGPAEAFCRQSLALDPSYAAPHAVLGKVLLSAGRIEESLPHFQASIRLDPAYPDSHYGEGIALLRLGRTDEARRRFLALQESDPGGPATVWLGETALASGSPREAAEWFHTAWQQPANRTPQTANGLARSLLLLGDAEGARNALQSIDADRRDPDLARDLGLPFPGSSR